jgi:hypothetical protein
MGSIEEELKRLQDAAVDAAKIGAREIKRGVEMARMRIERVKLVQQRKELLAELGLVIYELHQQNVSQSEIFTNSDAIEILADLKVCDEKIADQSHYQSTYSGADSSPES